MVGSGLDDPGNFLFAKCYNCLLESSGRAGMCAKYASSLRSPAMHVFRSKFSGHEHRQLYRLWNWAASRPTHLLEVH